MGSQISHDEGEQFITKLNFIESVEDQHFGPLAILRFKQQPYEYVMDYQKNFVQGDLRSWQQYLQSMKKLRTIEHKNISKIHFVEPKQQIHLCIKGIKVHTYCSYYNFTLRNGINQKKIRETRFTQSQIIYVLWCLLEVAKQLHKYNLSFGQYRADHIYLSPEGYVKLYLLEIDPNNKHRSYHKGLVERQKIDQLVLSPQELHCMYQLEAQPRIDIYKADVFAIALIALQLMTLEDLKFYYNEERNGLKIGRIQFDLNSLNSQYSSQFLDFLRNCLQENPNYRLSLEEASIGLENLKRYAQNVSYCIRLQDSEAKKKKPESIKSNYILSGIEKRLTPTPIEAFSQSTSSGLQSKGTASRNSQSRFGR